MEQRLQSPVVHITLKVPIDLDKRLRYRAAEQRTSRSQILREAAELYLTTDPKDKEKDDDD